MPRQRKIQRVTAYPSSSSTLQPHYNDAASRLGAVLYVIRRRGRLEIAALTSVSP